MIEDLGPLPVSTARTTTTSPRRTVQVSWLRSTKRVDPDSMDVDTFCGDAGSGNLGRRRCGALWMSMSMVEAVYLLLPKS